MKVIKTRGNKKLAIKQAIEELSNGGLIVYPTETCYGIGVDATNPKAIKKLLSFKGTKKKGISIAVSGIEMAKKYVNINDTAQNLYNNFLPGPITVISESKNKIDSKLESDNTLGIRIPNHNFTLELIKKFGKPITATSANTTGKKQPYSLQDFQKYTSLKKQSQIDLFINDGKLEERPASTVVDTTTHDTKVVRQGSIKIHQTSSNTHKSDSPEKTQSIAQKIIHKHIKLIHRAPLIIALQGELGSGKTQFVKGIGKHLNIKETITSPTYTIMKEYKHKKGTLHHIDTWRLKDQAELQQLGVNKLLKKKNIIAIEWSQKAKNTLSNLNKKTQILWITIDQNNDGSRTITHKLQNKEQ